MPDALPICLILVGKHAFVKSQLEAGKVPTSAMLAQFLHALVAELLPHVKAAPAAGDVLKAGLTKVGWGVNPNAALPGSLPPAPDAVLAFIDDSLKQLLPSLATARADAATAARALAEEERELHMMEEEALDGELSGKQQRTLAACQAKIPALKSAATASAKLVSLVESRLSPGEIAEAEKADDAIKGMASMRLAQATKEAAAASAGKGGGKGGGGKGGGGRGGGGGGRGGASAEPLDREARAAEAAARAATKAASDAKAAEDMIAALRASDITLVEASELRKGGHVLLAVSGKEEPCRIQELTSSKTGKHGHSKIAVTAVDVASGRKVERNLRADERVTVPGKRWLMAIGGGPVAIE